jgi:Lrp/AsnC family leucine-responsive transcriptional regulator
MSHIDSIDEHILGELQANGRLTMKALAERVGLSSPAMIERVRRLEDRGVISGYRAIVAPESLGRSIATLILVRLNGANETELAEVAQNNDAITELHRLTGTWTHLLRAHVASLTELEQLVDSVRALGAICDPSIITSSPIAWREMLPPIGPNASGRGAVRRGVSTGAGDEDEELALPPRRRGPGRPRRVARPGS